MLCMLGCPLLPLPRNCMTMLKPLNFTSSLQKSPASQLENNMTVNQALSEYLNQCNKGEHVVLKSYSSFAKSVVNRQCFLYNFTKIFETETNTRNGLDYYQLFRLLCSDFPKQIVVNSVRLLQGQGEKMLEGLLESKKFLHSLYIHFIYSQYMDSMLQKVFKGNNDEGVPLSELYEWVKEQDAKNIKTNEKPSMEIILQIVLNFLSNKSLLKTKGLVFLNEETVDDYIKECLGQREEESLVSFDEFTLALLSNKSHSKLVENNLGCFDNSVNWANEAVKVLMTKQSNPQPLNTKKVKKK